ncbi:hypothetical protein BKH43_06205 [Helicobacter sp. 13S00401-1]|uniref:tRNA1(Val) (adenine(37)-N6)-methyltransferase n=1 Tax=Helicobacter sp. 13S00401-1 TaxID=1905758 RepID=UPI000BA61784|nr:methyltransferase [Helicobacter sp. 13S00401-1]PAF50082.1 hypothetical protein BKH43_06205 [Helicobacter sp. 13S00401-1]
MQLYQASEGYCYNSDTLFLWDFAKDFLKKDMQVLDIGSGVGTLGLLLAKEKSIRLTQVEKLVLYAKLNIKNAEVNNIESSIINKDFLDYETTLKFDLIVSNPPFYHPNAIESKNDLLKHARHASSLPLDKLFTKAKRLLKPSGFFLLSYGSNQLSEVLKQAFANKLNVEKLRFIHPRLNAESKTFLCALRLNSKSSLSVLSPLITHIGKNQLENSQEVSTIYKNANTYSIKVSQRDIDL